MNYITNNLSLSEITKNLSTKTSKMKSPTFKLKYKYSASVCTTMKYHQIWKKWRKNKENSCLDFPITHFSMGQCGTAGYLKPRVQDTHSATNFYMFILKCCAALCSIFKKQLIKTFSKRLFGQPEFPKKKVHIYERIDFVNCSNSNQYVWQVSGRETGEIPAIIFTPGKISGRKKLIFGAKLGLFDIF